MKTKNKIRLAIGAASLISGAVVSSVAVAGEEDLGRCTGANTCKGQSACKSASNDCAGQNSCEGKGWIKVDKETCDATGVGKFDPNLKFEPEKNKIIGTTVTGTVLCAKRLFIVPVNSPV